MSDQHKWKVCPNCGFHATENYCARCGQETHLHNDTFWGLIVHFAGHYFHYDSKFWQTLKALWFSPGKLTIAYWNQQRMRYIPPISLYIFISAVFFLISSLRPNNYIKIAHETPSTTQAGHLTYGKAPEDDGISIIKFNLAKKDKDPRAEEEMRERIIHNIPKIFFFMIPLMALVLHLLFVRRKEMLYVNHVIYALHFHSFWFSVMILNQLYVFKNGAQIASAVAFLLSACYFVAALRNAYKISWGRSILYSVVTALVYLIFIVIILVLIIQFLTRG